MVSIVDMNGHIPAAKEMLNPSYLPHLNEQLKYDNDI